MEWGWNLESIAALGTAAATAFAAIASVIAVVELLRRRRADERHQAVLVGAWTEVDRRAYDPETGEGIVCRLHVANRSQLPVFNMVVTCAPRLGEDREPVQHWHSVGSGETVSEQVWRPVHTMLLGTRGRYSP